MEPASSEPRSILNQPLVAFGRSICGDLTSGLRREWLITNGLGGYASGTIAGALTRSYHGLLVAALEPPVARTVLVAAFDEKVLYDGGTWPLSTHEFAGGIAEPAGYKHLSAFHLQGALPVWMYAIADALIERRVWMERGQNTTYVTFRLVRGSQPCAIEVSPLVTCRSFHALTRSGEHTFSIDAQENAALVAGDETRFRISSDLAGFIPDGQWWWNFHFRQETARGLGDTGDLFGIGRFTATLQPGETLTFVLSTEIHAAELDAGQALSRALAHQDALLQQAREERSHPVAQQLVLAADQMLVARPMPDDPDGRSVIAGYHWFNDWGRDTMIALPGLCLNTGRAAEAESILRTFARFVDQGLLPNNFPDHAGVIPGYNTVDATLWYVLAIAASYETTGNAALVGDLLPVLVDIVEHHLAGTRYNIGVDPADSLLRAGEPGVQLTWMDARVGDWVVTPRIGKPVEINALWYNALRIVSGFLAEHGDPERAKRYGSMANQVRASFLQRYRRSESDHLADVVDGPDGDDWSVRPNQIFALSLPYPLIDGDEARAVLDAIARELLTDFGLRSLSPNDPAYRGSYGGDQVHRDGAYHQGPVWGWLLGPFVEASFRLHGDRDAALRLLAPVEDHLLDAGLGSISEIFEGDAPHRPDGCIAQAWSVAEVLRVWQMIDTPGDSRFPGDGR
jgi:predicted glycogen debranching enzyme